MSGAAVLAAASACLGGMPEVAAQGLGATSAPAFSSSELLRFGQQADAQGIKMGSFMIFPSLSIGAGYDTNLFAENKNARGTATYRADAEVNAVSNWSRHSLQMYVSGGGVLNDDFSSEDYGHLRTGASFQIDVYRDLWVRGFADLSIRPEERGTGESFVDFNRMINSTTAKYGGYVHKGFNRLWTELGASASTTHFGDVTLAATAGHSATIIDQSFRSGTTYDVFGRLGYDVSPLTSVYVETAYNQRDYGSGGVFDSDGYRVLGGVRYQYSAVTSGDFAFGYLHQNASSFIPQSEIDTYSYRGSLNWVVTPLITLRAIGSRDIGGPSNYAGASNRINSELGVTANYAILRNLTLSAGFGYDWSEYVGLDATDSRYRITLGAQYYLNQYVSLFSKYDHSEFEPGKSVAGTVVPTAYARDLILAGVRLRY